MSPKFIVEFIPGTTVVLAIVVETNVVRVTVVGSVEITGYETLNTLKCKNFKSKPR